MPTPYALAIKKLATSGVMDPILAPVESHPYSMKLRGQTYFLATLADASKVYQMVRDESGEGGSTFPDGKVSGPEGVYRISYNGRVWKGLKTKLSDRPVLEAA